jgi:hypothetical protein
MLAEHPDDDIRLVYIGSAHKAIGYAYGHLPEPGAKAGQILAVTSPGELAGVYLPPDCHIAIELHTTKKDGVQHTYATVEDHGMIFSAALLCRRRVEKGKP